MGGCLGVGPAPSLQPYEVAESPPAPRRDGPASKFAQQKKRNNQWSQKGPPPGVGDLPPPKRRNSGSKDGRDSGHAERERSRSKNGKSSAASLTAPLTPSFSQGSRNQQNGDPSASWRDGAAFVTHQSISDAQIEQNELDDWQRGIVDILEEQSIQAYDMDVSMGPNLERRYSNSMLGFSSQNGPVNLAALLESPMGVTGRSLGVRQSRLASNATAEPNPTILVVDEHPSTRQIITKWLTSSKYTEISCASGNQAMDILVPPAGSPVHRVDLIICDVNVVAQDGQLLLDWVINHDVSISAIPVIVLSSNLPSQGLERLIRRGAWDVLHKPLNRAVFLNALATVFTTRRQKAFIEKLRITGDEYKARFYSRSKQGIPMHVRNSFAQAGVVMSPAPDARTLTSGTMSPSENGRGLQGGGWPAERTVSPSSSFREPAQLQPIQVLLIEQDPERAQLLRSWIETPAVTVRHVLSVQEAVPIMRESQKAAIMAASTSISPVQLNTSLMHPQPLMQRSTSTGETPPPPARPLGLGHNLPHGSSSPAQPNRDSSGASTPTKTSPAQPGRTISMPTQTEMTRSTSAYVVPSALSPQTGYKDSRVSMFTANLLPTLQQRTFGIELIIVGHDALIPHDCLNEDLATLGVEEDPPPPPGDTLEQLTTEEDDSLASPSPIEGSSRTQRDHRKTGSGQGIGGGERTSREGESVRKATLSPVVGLAAAQMLVDLSLQPVWGKARRLPIVVVCEEDGPSPVAMAILKHVALTILNAPLSPGLVNRRMGLILSLIEQNRQSLTLARRAHMYKGLLTNLVGSNPGEDGSAETSEIPASPGLRHIGLKNLLNSDREARSTGGKVGSPTERNQRMSNRSMSGTISAAPSAAPSPYLTAHPVPESGSLLTRARPSVVAEGRNPSDGVLSPSQDGGYLSLSPSRAASPDLTAHGRQHKPSSRARAESPAPSPVETVLPADFDIGATFTHEGVTPASNTEAPAPVPAPTAVAPKARRALTIQPA
jgi:CheY-like chemotaxis protein